MYLTATRPDLMFIAKIETRYLKGTFDFEIFYRKGKMMNLLLTLIVIMLEI